MLSKFAKLDRIAIEEFSTPSYELMCRAGQSLLDAAQMRWPAAKRVLIVCGGGNNGGDGYVLARLLMSAGTDVQVLAAFEPDTLKGDARRAAEDFFRLGGDSRTVNEWPQEENFDLLVDALFGSGLCREISGGFADLVHTMNTCGVPVLAVDVPSGLEASSGSVLGIAVKAQLTMTFIGQKRGLLTNDGPDQAGQVFLDDLGVPQAVFDRVRSSVYLAGHAKAVNSAQSRRINAHKGSCGSILVIGGDTGMQGAAVLSANAAIRTGAGLVRLAMREKTAGNGLLPDVITVPSTSEKSLLTHTALADVLAVGPGLGQSSWAQECLTLSLASEVPCVIDADGLNLLAQSPRKQEKTCILTPHPAEAARLLGIATKDVQKDRFGAVEKLAKHYSAVVVLKGCGSLVSDGEQTVLCDRGNPGMACAGMGDVLTGIIAAMLAEGMEPLEAAVQGVCLHAHAGDHLFSSKGNRLIASDIPAVLPEIRYPQ